MHIPGYANARRRFIPHVLEPALCARPACFSGSYWSGRSGAKKSVLRLLRISFILACNARCFPSARFPVSLARCSDPVRLARLARNEQLGSRCYHALRGSCDGRQRRQPRHIMPDKMVQALCRSFRPAPSCIQTEKHLYAPERAWHSSRCS